MFQLKGNLVFTFTPALKQNPLSEIYPQVNIIVTSVELKQWEMDLLDLSQHFLLGFLPYIIFGNENLCIHIHERTIIYVCYAQQQGCATRP
jgi:hypothetical protein